jgi:hypothetical protein
MTRAPPKRRPAAPRKSPALAAASTPADARREHWTADAGERDVAVLAIPPHAQRERRFEIFCRLEVANKAGHVDATHALRVHVDGALEWSRSVPTHPGGSDSLDLHLRRTVPAGQALRVTASAETCRSTRLRLTIAAEEDEPSP